MIGLLKGRAELFNEQCLLIEVSGVGYKVFVPTSILSKIQTGEEIKLFIHTHVRDDALDLYGFLELLDLRLFEYLISVSGIGPKTALGIFSIGDNKTIVNAIINGEVSFFTTVPRLGKKNAQKIIIELKSKLGSARDLDLFELDSEGNNDVVVVLKNFGFTSFEINKVLKEVSDKGKTSEEKIKLALKYLGKI